MTAPLAHRLLKMSHDGVAGTQASQNVAWRRRWHTGFPKCRMTAPLARRLPRMSH